MTTNDRLQEAVEKYGSPLSDHRVVVNLDDVPRIAYRAGLDAAQPVPTDAEIEAAIREYVHSAADAEVSAQMRSWDGYEYHGEEAAKARDNLLRLIAQQREAAVREALESVREKLGKLRETFPPTPDYDSSERMIYGCGYDVGLLGIKRHIDAMLAREDGDE